MFYKVLNKPLALFKEFRLIRFKDCNSLIAQEFLCNSPRFMAAAYLEIKLLFFLFFLYVSEKVHNSAIILGIEPILS